MAQDQATVEPKSTRDAIRWGLLLAAIAVAGFRLPRAVSDLRVWHEVRLSDPSAADFYKTSLKISLIGIAVILCGSIAVFYLLRKRAQMMGQDLPKGDQ